MIQTPSFKVTLQFEGEYLANSACYGRQHGVARVSQPGMLRPRGLCGLGAKLFGLSLIVSGLGGSASPLPSASCTVASASSSALALASYQGGLVNIPVLILGLMVPGFGLVETGLVASKVYSMQSINYIFTISTVKSIFSVLA